MSIEYTISWLDINIYFICRDNIVLSIEYTISWLDINIYVICSDNIVCLLNRLSGN